MSKKQIPSEITIDGKVLKVKDVPELLGLIEAVRGEEKDKLYGEIAKLEAKVTGLEDKSKLTEAEAAELKDLRKQIARKEVELEAKDAELDAAKKAGKAAEKINDDDDEGDDKKSGKTGKAGNAALMAELKAFMTEQLSGVTSQLDTLKKEVETKVGEVSGGLKAKTVGDYRKQQLAKYADVIVSDLVPDNLDSEEAVNKAIERALERSQDLIYKEVDGKRLSLREIADAEKAKKEDAGKGGGTYTPPGAPPTPPGKGDNGDITDKVLLKDVKNMSPEEFAKHRAKLLAEVKQVKYTGEAEE